MLVIFGHHYIKTRSLQKYVIGLAWKGKEESKEEKIFFVEPAL